MVHISSFEFSPFQENTYIVYGDNKDCWIVDPGCYGHDEQRELNAFMSNNKLNPKRLLNTHCHLDHVFGNAFVHRTYGLLPEYHFKEEPTMAMAEMSAKMYGIQGFESSPMAKNHLTEGEKLILDNTEVDVVFCPGHAPGHLVFVFHKEAMVIGGDVLFNGSIGRTDLPGGDHSTLLKSIQEKLYTLPDHYIVHCGHGPSTTIGKEKKSNPFVRST